MRFLFYMCRRNAVWLSCHELETDGGLSLILTPAILNLSKWWQSQHVLELEGFVLDCDVRNPWHSVSLSQRKLVSWCFEPCHLKGLHQGWTQTSVHLQATYCTSHNTASLCLPNHSSNSIQNFGTEYQKNNNTSWSVFIFREHSTREPASSRVTYFILRACTGTGVSHS